jgi:aminoglycoside 3-N-acetyltransferase
MTRDFSKIYTKEDILSQLAEMNIPRDRVVLAHSSLRLIGKVEGGAAALLDALIEYFTLEGGLFCVPTHTWANLKNEITLDMNDPATCLGALSNIAAADPRGIRSENPTHSMVVYGNRARALDFIKDETAISSGTDPNSCYGKLYREGGYVLLIGVAHNKNTYLHCVEEILGTPNRLSEPRQVVVKRLSGELVTRQLRTHKADFTRDISARFPKYEPAFRYHGAITDGFIGNAPTQACDAVIMKETVELIRERCGGGDPLSDDLAIPPVWYR